MAQFLFKFYKLSSRTSLRSKCFSSFSKKEASKSNILQMIKFVKGEKYRLTGAVGLLFISSGVTLTVPLIVGKLIDYISTGKRPSDTIMIILQYLNIESFQSDQLNKDFKISTNDTIKLGSLALGFFVLGGLANFGRFYLIQTAGQRIIVNLRNRLYKSLIYKPVEFYDRNKSGELISRISSDSTVVGEGLSNNMSNGLRSSLQTILGVTMMGYVSPQLSLFSLAILPPVMGFPLIFGRYIKKVSNNLQQCVAVSTEKANETLSAIRTVKAFCKEQEEIDNYKRTTSSVLTTAYNEALLRGSFFGLTGLTGNVLLVSLLFYGGSLINSGSLTIGDLSSFLIYAGYATFSFGGMGSFYTELMKASGAGSRLWQLLQDDTVQARPTENSQIIPANCQFSLGDIKFENVSFSYPTRPDQVILNDFSLCLPRGKTTAIIGPSGCGKSSVVCLLLKFYDVDSGKLLIGDKPLSEIDNYMWKDRVAAVLQDPVLFSCSIAENIAYGAKSGSVSNVTASDIERVAEVAQVMEFAKNLPEGLDTKIGERGVLLSGGQRQRIAIARALMSNPDIVILDEAMSALDNENEWLVQQAINKIFRGRTVLTISHRLALLRSADQIAVIDKGRVVQLGKFEELSECDNNEKNQENLFRKLLHNSF